MTRDAYYDESVLKIKLQEEKLSFVIRSLQVNETPLLAISSTKPSMCRKEWIRRPAVWWTYLNCKFILRTLVIGKTIYVSLLSRKIR